MNTGCGGRAAAAIVLLMLIVAVAAVGCRSPGAAPVSTGDPANGVTIDNATDQTVSIVYEHPDGTTESLTDLAPGGHVVIDQIFAGREGLCRTGRLVAKDSAGAEVDELYLVCRAGLWTVEAG
jgi:hypothetical protein